jgi:hypothetical protein
MADVIERSLDATAASITHTAPATSPSGALPSIMMNSKLLSSHRYLSTSQPIINICTSVAMAQLTPFSKNGYCVPNKRSKFPETFDKIEELKS